jgi:hypothetical protein
MNRMGFQGYATRGHAGMRSTCGPWVPIPFSLHPDYDRRPRDHTGSADLAAGLRKQSKAPSARGLYTLRVITAGGELHPALRTLPPEPWRRRVFNTVFQKLHGRRID